MIKNGTVYSINDKIVLKKYTPQGITHDVKNGFATVQQKKALVGLEVLVSSHVSGGQLIEKGSTLFFEEEVLMSPTSAAKLLKKAPFLEEEFIVLDYKLAVCCFVPCEKEKA